MIEIMAQIINGKELAEKIKDEIVKEIVRLNSGATCCAIKRPNLAIILIGEREDSKIYVNLKKKEAKKVGIDTHLYKCPENISEHEVLDMIKCLNNDDAIDAILVQLPLPAGFDTDMIIRAINPKKDVDGFHPDNLKTLFKTRDHARIMPPVFEAILEMLKSIKYELKGKQVCVISNSKIFGKALARVLECRQAKVAAIRADNAGLKEKTSRADILITAAGKPKFIKKDMVKKDAVVIDVGITKKDGKICGDVDFEDVKNKASFITPVPGGVGPMTIAMALKNTLELYKRRRNK